MKTKRLFILTAIICLASLFSVDLAYAYHPVSPYAYCMNNPVRYVDPQGEDVWEFDEAGNVVNHIQTKEHDAFYMVQQVDGAWQRTGQELVFEYGTVTGYRTPTVNVSDGNGGVVKQQLAIFEMKGDNNATQLFEFIANPGVTTNVEWTHAKIGTESSDRNIVGTSHNQSSTAVGGYLLGTGYTLREVNHNHPSGAPLPSGGDMRNATRYMGAHPNVGLNIYVPTSGYSPYNSHETTDSRITKLPDGSFILPDGRHIRRR